MSQVISKYTVADNLQECTSIELQLITANPKRRDPYSGALRRIATHHLKISKKNFRNAFEEYLGFREPTAYVGGNPDNLPFTCYVEKGGKMIIGIDCRTKSENQDPIA